MTKNIASLIIFVWFFAPIPVALAAYAGAGGATATAVPDPHLVEKWQSFNGKKISQVQFSGLKRTREQSCRWLMESLEGTTFNSYQFAVDIQTLSNTGDLYDVTSTVSPDPKISDGIILTIFVDDKWTLLPVFGGQGGGGAYTYGGGIYDSNLLGTFTTAQALLYNYNGVLSYSVSVYNEFIADTQMMGGLTWSNNISPSVIHNIDGSSAGNFTWQRQQEEVMIGTHLPGLIRFSFFIATFFDGMTSVNGVNASVYSGNQYRLHPRVIIGRVNIVDFLEEGNELTVQPMATNPFGPVQAYQGVDVRFKQVVKIGNSDNFGYDLFAGTMNTAPSPYLYEVGGYSSLRGYIENRQIGPYTAFGNVEYRPYLYQHRFKSLLGIEALDIDKVALQGCFFTDFGSAWGDATLTGDQGAKQINVLWSIGAGLRVNFLHFAGAIMRLDVARTLRPDEGWGLSFGVGQFF